MSGNEIAKRPAHQTILDGDWRSARGAGEGLGGVQELGRKKKARRGRLSRFLHLVQHALHPAELGAAD